MEESNENFINYYRHTTIEVSELMSWNCSQVIEFFIILLLKLAHYVLRNSLLPSTCLLNDHGQTFIRIGPIGPILLLLVEFNCCNSLLQQYVCHHP